MLDNKINGLLSRLQSFLDCTDQDDYAVYFNTHRRAEGCTPESDASFAFNKLTRDSYWLSDQLRLSAVQEERLMDVCGETWDEYCSVLSAAQIAFVGW